MTMLTTDLGTVRRDDEETAEMRAPAGSAQCGCFTSRMLHIVVCMDVWTSKRQYYQASATQPRALQGEAAAADSAHQQRTPPRRQTCLPTKCSSNPKAVHACATRQTPADDACRSRLTPLSRPLDRPLESRYSTAGTVSHPLVGGSTVHCEIPKFPPLPFAWLLAVGAGPRSRVRACTWR